MSIDGTVKRYFPGVIGGLLLAVAFFQAKGISALIAEQLPSEAPPMPRAQVHVATELPADASPIIKRNPFDSVTGPLTPKPTANVKPVDSKPAPPPSDDNLPSCSGGSVSVISSATDPAYSFAVIKSGTSSQLRRIGDDVDGKAIAHIEEARVILGEGGERCQLAMHELGATSSSKSTVVEPSSPTEPRAPVMPGNRAGVGQGITKVSDTSYVIEENGAQKLTQVRDAFMRSAKLVDGEGVRLYRSAQTTVLGQLGLKKGDVIKSMNGFDMSSVDQSTQAYGALKGASAIKLTVMRDGKEVGIDVEVKP